MNVDKILRTGYFDEIKVDGTVKPIYHSSGTVILPESTFKELLEQSNDRYKHGVANIRIQLTGESAVDANVEELEEMREDRELSGIKRLTGTPVVDRYLIAYADILLLKSDYSLPYKLKSSGKDNESLIALGSTPDMKEMLMGAHELAIRIEDKYNYPKECIAIAIVNKVYVTPVFRRSGISTWLHQNMADLINMYGMIYPTGIILTYGDFSHEASKLFKMDNSAYNKMLKTHYKKLGYKMFSTGIVTSDIGENASLMYKMLI